MGRAADIEVRVANCNFSNINAYREEVQTLVEQLTLSELRNINRLALAGQLVLPEPAAEKAPGLVSVTIMVELTKMLSQYGDVSLCREHNGRFEVAIQRCKEESFYQRMVMVVKLIQSYVGNVYPNVDAFSNELKTFHLKLKR